MELQEFLCVFPQSHDQVVRCLKYQTFRRKYYELLDAGEIQSNKRSMYPRLNGSTKRGFKSCEELYERVSNLTNTNISKDYNIDILDIIHFCKYVGTTDDEGNNSPYYKPYDKEGGFLCFTCRCDTYINKLGLEVKQMEDFFDDEDITFQQAIIQDVIMGEQEKETPCKVDILVQHIKHQELTNDEILQLIKRIL